MTEAHGDSDLETPVPEDGDLLGTAVDSVNVAFWTIVTRVTGLARIATVAAVLGPTYLGNLFQAANTLPNLAYEMLAGTLLVSVLVPSLVGHVDRRDVRATERLAGGFLGLVSVGFVVAAVVVVALGPLVLRGLSLAVPDASVVADQRRVGWPLLAMLMPQIVLYGVASTGAAVMNAHGRFALAAAAPALENLGVVATVGALGVLFPSELSLAGVHGPALLVLGLGTTGAVGLHAAAQWWGARRLGVSLRPRPGWRDPELRKPIRRMVPSAGYAALNSVRMVAILVMTNRVAGGVVAFQLALSFFYLPIALAARPIGVALLPRLSRLHQEGGGRLFRDELVRGAQLATFLTIPASLFFVVMSVPLVRAISLGAMRDPSGRSLVVAALAALAVSVPAEAGIVLATQAAYARHDARSPLHAMFVRTGVSLVLMGGALALGSGPAVVMVIGAAVSVGNVAGTWYLTARLRENLPPGDERLGPAIRAGLRASLLTLGPAYPVTVGVARLVGGGPAANAIGLVAGGAAGAAVLLGLQRLHPSPELAGLSEAVSTAWSRRRVARPLPR